MVFQWNNYRSYWRQENPLWRTGWETIPELSPGLSSDFLSNLEAKCLICLFPTYKLRLMMPPLDTQGEDLGALVWAGKPLSCRKSSKTRLTGDHIVSATDFDRAKLWPILGDRRSQGKSKCTHKISFLALVSLASALSASPLQLGAPAWAESHCSSQRSSLSCSCVRVTALQSIQLRQAAGTRKVWE